MRESNKCVICLKDFNDSIKDDSKTEEHVFPKSWYPESTPNDLEKWKVPSCRKCNSEYSRYEQSLLIRLGLGLFKEDEKCSGIIEKARRSINPAYAKNERDRQKRLKCREKIKRDLIILDKIPSEGILPNFGSDERNKYKKYPILLIKAGHLKKFAIKIVRGMTFLFDGFLIEDDYEIGHYFEKEEDRSSVIKMINKFGITEYRGPGIVVGRAVAHNDPKSSLYRIDVWGKLKICATVTKIKQIFSVLSKV